MSKSFSSKSQKKPGSSSPKYGTPSGFGKGSKTDSAGKNSYSKNIPDYKHFMDGSGKKPSRRRLAGGHMQFKKQEIDILISEEKTTITLVADSSAAKASTGVSTPTEKPKYDNGGSASVADSNKGAMACFNAYNPADMEKCLVKNKNDTMAQTMLTCGRCHQCFAGKVTKKQCDDLGDTGYMSNVPKGKYLPGNVKIPNTNTMDKAGAKGKSGPKFGIKPAADGSKKSSSMDWKKYMPAGISGDKGFDWKKFKNKPAESPTLLVLQAQPIQLRSQSSGADKDWTQKLPSGMSGDKGFDWNKFMPQKRDLAGVHVSGSNEAKNQEMIDKETMKRILNENIPKQAHMAPIT